jgi:iron complex transport system substrate-binding protein
VRIVSFLPAGTEIACALGARDDLVGRSHECDFPASVSSLPILSRPALHLDGLTPGEVDRAVAERLHRGESLYEIDERLLAELSPDVVLTQDLCQVCAPSGNELSRALRELPHRPEVGWLTPTSIVEIEENVLTVGELIGRRAAADSVVSNMRERIAAVQRALSGARPRRVAFLEWTDPPFCAGHWVPEMIALAGGDDPLGKPAADSQRVTWDDIRASSPEIVLVAPCGCGLDQSLTLARTIPDIPGAQVYAVDANAYFARPGPRVVDGIELLASLFHPDRVPGSVAGAVRLHQSS